MTRQKDWYNINSGFYAHLSEFHPLYHTHLALGCFSFSKLCLSFGVRGGKKSKLAFTQSYSMKCRAHIHTLIALWVHLLPWMTLWSEEYDHRQKTQSEKNAKWLKKITLSSVKPSSTAQAVITGCQVPFLRPLSINSSLSKLSLSVLHTNVK